MHFAAFTSAPQHPTPHPRLHVPSARTLAPSSATPIPWAPARALRPLVGAPRHLISHDALPVHAPQQPRCARPLAYYAAGSAVHLRLPRAKPLFASSSQAPSEPAPGDPSLVAESSQESTPDAAENADTTAPARPEWAPAWLPNWAVSPPPWLQLVIALPLYVLHLLVFSKKSWTLPKPVIPNSKGLLTVVSLDSIVGLAVLLFVLAWRNFVTKSKPLVPNLFESTNPPWKITKREVRTKILPTTVILIAAYILSGYGAVFFEQVLIILSMIGVPITVPTMRAWKVLLGHLMWVYMGTTILVKRLKPFFPPTGKWLSSKWNTNWLWWSIGGFYVSAFLFNCADALNQFILPSSVFNNDGVVAKLVNPENKDLVAMAVGSIGPCVSAPVFEEVLYRGYLLPALTCFFPLSTALPISSVLFAIHHLNVSGIIPLTVLGLAWAIIYTQSNNLLVTVLIHAMWNSRVFLSSLLS